MYDVLTPSPSAPTFRPDLPDSPISVGPSGPLASASVLARMLDIVDYGVLLVHRDGQVVFANQIARGELDALHPLQLLGKQLRVRRPQDVAPLRAAISSACRLGLQKLVTLGDGAEIITISVVPVSDSDVCVGHGAMLLFGQRKGCGELSIEAFARHYNLTAAELRVLKALCAGRRPSDIARDQGVALSTVRTQIGCARAKTGASSISDLLRQVTQLPPMLSLLRLTQ